MTKDQSSYIPYDQRSTYSNNNATSNNIITSNSHILVPNKFVSQKSQSNNNQITAVTIANTKSHIIVTGAIKNNQNNQKPVLTDSYINVGKSGTNIIVPQTTNKNTNAFTPINIGSTNVKSTSAAADFRHRVQEIIRRYFRINSVTNLNGQYVCRVSIHIARSGDLEIPKIIEGKPNSKVCQLALQAIIKTARVPAPDSSYYNEIEYINLYFKVDQ